MVNLNKILLTLISSTYNDVPDPIRQHIDIKTLTTTKLGVIFFYESQQ